MTSSSSCLKLLGPTMFRAFRCIWMLEELGVPYEHVLAKPWGKTAQTFHPQGKIPILVDGDFVLYESAAINTYLAEKYNETIHLLPPPRTQERALYDQTTLCIMTEMDAQGLWIHRKHAMLGKYFGTSPEAVKEAKRQFEKTHQVMKEQLHKPGPYLLGRDFTAVDILYVHCLDWAMSIGWFQAPTEEGALHTYLQLCKSRPAYQRTIAKRKAEHESEKQKELQSKI